MGLTGHWPEKKGDFMQYLFTERAHLMCPHMCFGIVMAVRRGYDEGEIRRSLNRLAAAHPFLRSFLGYEKDRNAYFYDITDQSKTQFLPTESGICGIESPEVMDTYRKLTGYDWNLFEEGMLKVTAWKMQEETCFLLVFHHLLTDGRGALGLARELADDYSLGIGPEPVGENLISSVQDFPANSRMPFISRFLVSRVNKIAAKEKRQVSYGEYHRFADDFLSRDPVRYSLSETDSEELAALHQKCRDHQVTINDYLLAKMMADEKTDRIIMACDLRGRLACYRIGAMGNYSTAFSVIVKRDAGTLFDLAGKVHARVRQIMDCPADLYLVLQCYANLSPEALDAALISCRGGFPGKAGKFVGSTFFGFEKGDGCSITNLGKTDSRSMPSAYFIPPASPAMRKTLGVLTVNGVMRVCTAER